MVFCSRAGPDCPLATFYPGTTWAAHGNYGVEYPLTLPLLNDTPELTTLQLALESPQEREFQASVVSPWWRPRPQHAGAVPWSRGGAGAVGPPPGTGVPSDAAPWATGTTAGDRHHGSG